MLSILSTVLGLLMLVALGVQLWQFAAAWRFPLHKKSVRLEPSPAITILKPLKGTDAHTAACLASWFDPEYSGPREILFGVHHEADPVCEVVRSLIQKYPDAHARLVICGQTLGINAKVSTLIQLRREASHSILVVSDADVRIPPGALQELVAPLHDPAIGMVNCFYRLANPTTWAMRWEAVCINADFWSQVLQSITLKPQDFALGAAMAFRTPDLGAIGGFESLADHLADDYQLGNRLSKRGLSIGLCTTPVECWDSPAGWGAVWQHQLRWNRTIRVCQPAPYAASILSNLGLWTVAWWAARHDHLASTAAISILIFRMVLAGLLTLRIESTPKPIQSFVLGIMAPLKDLLGAALWAAALFGNRVVWRGIAYEVQQDGRLVKS